MKTHHGIHSTKANYETLAIFKSVVTDSNIIVEASNDIVSLSYYLDKSQAMFNNAYDKFIDGVKRVVRNSLTYKKYIAYVRNDLGLTRDAFRADLVVDGSLLEMHHGPILSLQDYAQILVDYSYDMGLPISTYDIARLILKEHAKNQVQITLVTEDNHKLIHAGQLFLHMEQCFGNVQGFITEYRKWVVRNPRLVAKITQYMQLIEDDTPPWQDLAR
jgi:hypothetical protein